MEDTWSVNEIAEIETVRQQIQGLVDADLCLPNLLSVMEPPSASLPRRRTADLQKGKVPMKTRCAPVLTALCLTLLSLGSASVAWAGSVTGGGTMSNGPGRPLTTIQVSATSRPSGNLRVSIGQYYLFGNVVSLDTEGDFTRVVALITQTSPDGANTLGRYLVLYVQDNGPKGDWVDIAVVDFHEFWGGINQGTLTHGNITVTP